MEMNKQKLGTQCGSELKSVGHINGLVVRSLSAPNIPSTISERASQKTAADNRRKSDALPSSTKSGVPPLSVNSAKSSMTVNGCDVGHLPLSSPASKSKISNGCETTSSPSHDIYSSKMMTDRDSACKKNKASAYECHSSKTTSDNCASRTHSRNKIHVPPSSGSKLTATKDVKHSPSKWNCCINLHKKDRVKTSGSSSELHDEASVIGGCSRGKSIGSTRGKSVGSTERTRKDAKKFSTSMISSFLSTTKWHVVRYSIDNVLPVSRYAVHATTTWHVTDVAGTTSDTTETRSSGVSALQTSDASSAGYNEPVRGGHEHMVNGISSSHTETGDKPRTSVKQTVNCTYTLTVLYDLCF